MFPKWMACEKKPKSLTFYEFDWREGRGHGLKYITMT